MAPHVSGDGRGGERKPFGGRVVFVTGAGSGVGEAVARRFVAAGASVLAVDVDGDGLDRLEGECAAPDQLLTVIADVAVRPQLDNAVSQARQRFGTVDTLAAVAGIVRSAPFADMTDDDRDAVLGVNFLGVWNATRASLPDIIESRRTGRPGRIVLCGSVESVLGSAGLAAYVASKHAIVGLAKSLALELAPLEITANVVSPAGVDTPMLQRALPPAAREAFIRSTPIARLSRPDEVAAFFLFVSSDDAGYLTGENIVVDGGTKVVNTHLVAIYGTATASG